MKQLLVVVLYCALFHGAALADGPPNTASHEHVSPKEPWRDFEIIEEEEPSTLRQALLWLPNRFLDLIDVVKIDVGAGPSAGGVIRATSYVQAGYREMSPLSVRVGTMGRRAPVMLERSNEFGIGPGYMESSDRKVCPGEFGAGLDLFIAGAYAGICVDELADFLTGLVLIDLKDDDLQ